MVLSSVLMLVGLSGALNTVVFVASSVPVFSFVDGADDNHLSLTKCDCYG